MHPRPLLHGHHPLAPIGSFWRRSQKKQQGGGGILEEKATTGPYYVAN